MVMKKEDTPRRISRRRYEENDMEEAEEINLCCAARLDCKALTLEE